MMDHHQLTLLILCLSIYACVVPFMLWIFLDAGSPPDEAGRRVLRAYWVPPILKREVCLWPVWLVVFLAPGLLWPVLFVTFGVVFIGVSCGLALVEVKKQWSNCRMVEDNATCCGLSIRGKGKGKGNENRNRDVEMGIVNEQPKPAPPAEVKTKATQSSTKKSKKPEATKREIEDEQSDDADQYEDAVSIQPSESAEASTQPTQVPSQPGHTVVDVDNQQQASVRAERLPAAAAAATRQRSSSPPPAYIP